MAAATPHADLINGLGKYYQTLIHEDYLVEQNVRSEPYAGDLDMSALGHLDFDPQVIDLLPLLPCLRPSFSDLHEVSGRVPLTADSDLISYAYMPENNPILEEARGVPGSQMLPRDEFKIASGYRFGGMDYAYSASKSMRFWLGL